MEEQDDFVPNYYAVIPSEVRYNEKLKANEKLLFGEITALSNKKGYCFATNNYFAKLYNVDKTTVSRWISGLENEGFIFTFDHITSSGTQRRIKLTPGSIPHILEVNENANSLEKKHQKMPTPIDEKIKGG